ncbi:tyrosine-type recombinase/integrase [Mycoplasma sp. P36-A1]|uniref:tyrosine-type recombinase/integrase n=1 Tax=Mycoplasma sp. P36-A1 TaxID=3252900 RepID=UPI003C2E8EF9
MIIKVEEYIEECINNELANNTVKAYKYCLKQFNKYCEDNNIQELSKRALISFKQYLISTYDNEKTINSKIVILNIYINWAYKNKIITLNPLDLKLKHMQIQDLGHREYLNKKEFKRLIKACDADYDIKSFILVIMNSGMRISEVCQITMHDLSKKSFTVRNKGKSSTKALPLWLRKQLEQLYSFKGPEEIIFNKSKTSYRSKLKRLSGKAKVKKTKVYPHALRHLFAKEYVKKGDISQLKQLLSHSNINTTAIYTEMNQEELVDIFRSQKNK